MHSPFANFNSNFNSNFNHHAAVGHARRAREVVSFGRAGGRIHRFLCIFNFKLNFKFNIAVSTRHTRAPCCTYVRVEVARGAGPSGLP